MPPIFYALMADALAAFHLGYVLFVVVGQIIITTGWILKLQKPRNPVFRTLHLTAILVVVLESLAGFLCPLTSWEYDLRRLAGQEFESDITFMGRVFHAILFYDFPPLFFTVLYTSFALLVIISFLCYPPRFKKRT